MDHQDIVRPFWHDAASLVISPECFDTFFQKNDFLNVPCLKSSLSKCLSLGIVLGSFLLKVPQIIKILTSKSAKGISLLSSFLELVNYTLSVAYHVRHGNPLMVWGENLNLAIQSFCILGLVISYNKEYFSGSVTVALYAAMVYILQDPTRLDNATLDKLVSGVIFLVIAARLPQIFANFRNRSTGQLSAITLLLTFAGSAARTFTTVHETPDDSVMLYSYLIATLLNGMLVLQLLMYWRAPSSTTTPSRKKKVA